MRIIFMTIILLTIPVIASSQIDIKRKIENKANQRANQRADQAIDKGLDAAEKGIKDSFSKGNNQEQSQDNKQEKDNKENKDEKAEEKSKQNNDDNSPSMEETPLMSYSKFDFIPGEKIVFFEDFSQDAVGDFPLLWNTNGSAEVVTTNLFPGHWMKFVCNESIWTDELLTLPDNYTIEFDVVPVAGEQNSMTGYQVRLYQAKNARAWDSGTAPGEGGFLYTIEYFGRPGYHTWFNKGECQQTGLTGYKEGDEFKQKMNQKYHISIWVQKTRIRLYQDQNKIFDLPRAFQSGCAKPDRIRFENGAAMVSNIRVAAGAPDMRSKLLTEGKLVSYGIYFDVNKDIVKPESYATLKEIASILTENPDVRIKIVGHTDSDGADAANLELSKRRGESVKNELVRTFSIDASRIESDGQGESQPVAPNDSPANKALNRRVEFIKL